MTDLEAKFLFSFSGRIDRCPSCKEELLRSCVLQKEDDELRMQCTACDKQYSVLNNEEQRSVMRDEYGKPFAIENIFDICQIGRGDIIEYTRMGDYFTTQHFAVCIDVRRETEEIIVSETKSSYLDRLPQTVTISINSLHEMDAKVFRFMPLDCLPLPDTIKRATEERLRFKISYSPSCFGGWCKIGEVKSPNEYNVSFFGTMGKILSNPMKMFQEFQAIGAGLDHSQGNATDETVMIDNRSPGWSSSKLPAITAEDALKSKELN